ncbi:MAG: RagB/SusD family nutrient uptake outer membrane protein [Paludibacteraceae bacterium]|nr:RagB/SusD family nutrient uptake outer membrane protein [Paludibacteraceae bacterium]
MKNIKYIIGISAVALLSSCKGDGFLSNESPSAMDASTVYSSTINTEQAIFGVYNLMGSNNSYRNRMACGFNGLNTDIEYSTKSSSTSAGEPDLMLYDCTVANTRVSNAGGSDIWSYLNTMIERCNNIIEGLEEYGNVEQRDTMAAFLGEAYFLRSFAYLEQVKFWGDVPARFVSLAKDEKGVDAVKSDRNEIYAHLRTDLLRAAELLPWSQERVGSAQNNVGRANKAAALALLARADLMYAGKAVRPNSIQDPSGYKVDYNVTDAGLRKEIYKEALDACAQIIKHDDYKLASDFATPFKQICSDVTSYKDMEHIWVMPFADGARGQVLNYNAPKISSNGQSSLPGHLPGYGSGGSSNGHICVSPAFVYAFDKDDKRRDITYVPGQWEYDNGSGESSTDSTRLLIFPNHHFNDLKLYMKHNQINNFYLGKFRFEWMADGRTLTSTDDGIDFPVLRYADVLLMFAEASIGGISGDVPANETGLDPLAEFNKVRTRAGLKGISALSMDAIMKERAFELCGEYVRKYDLMRWGNLKEKVMETAKTVRDMGKADSRHAMNLGDSIFYKYRFDAELNGYVMDSIYGLNYGEVSRPAYFNKATGWQAKEFFYSESKGNILSESNYPIYSSEEKLESRQYWPIFSTNIAASNGKLWNNYGYGE